MSLLAFIKHFGFAATIALISYFLTIVAMRRIVVVDIPNERSSHSIPVPRSGGLAIVVSFLIAIVVIQLFGGYVPIDIPAFAGFLGALLLVAAISFYDDLKPRGPWVKFGGQIFAILIAMAVGNTFDLVFLPWIGQISAKTFLYSLTFIWILGLTNTYNFLDGLDGMASATAVVACAFLSYRAFIEGAYFVYLVSLSLGAASFGFLLSNWSPAKIFMGDVGSTFLGFSLSLLGIIAARYDSGHLSLFVMPLLLLHFIFDALFTFGHRVHRREKLLHGHRTHIYQLLNRLGFSHAKVSLLYAGLAALQGLACILMISLPGEFRIYMFVPFVVVYCILGVTIRKRATHAGLI